MSNSANDREQVDRRMHKSTDLVRTGQMCEIYLSLTGRSYTRQELCATLPIRLIAAFQEDGSLLLGAYDSEWMAQRWDCIIGRIEVQATNTYGGSAIVHLAGDNL